MSFINLEDLSTEANRLQFILTQFTSAMRTVTLGRVEAVDESGLTIQPLISLVDQDKKAYQLPTLHGVPFLRLQTGLSAIIANPVIGDIGLLAVCDRDSTLVKSSHDISAPASLRRYNLSDAIYLGGLLNKDPTQYVKFTPGEDPQIEVVSPSKVHVKAPSVSVEAETVDVSAFKDATVTAPTVQIKGNLTVSGTITSSGNISTSGGITSTGEIVGAGISFSTHVHGGVQSGNSTTGKPR